MSPVKLATTAAFHLSEVFVSFPSWGTLFIGGRHYSLGGGQYPLVNNIQGDIIHGGPPKVVFRAGVETGYNQQCHSHSLQLRTINVLLEPVNKRLYIFAGEALNS